MADGKWTLIWTIYEPGRPSSHDTASEDHDTQQGARVALGEQHLPPGYRILSAYLVSPGGERTKIR